MSRRVVLRGILWSALFVALFMTVQAADPFPDDHGDAIAESTWMSIPATGVTIAARIEIDTDQDWFRFLAMPDTVYRLQAKSVSLWDLEVDFRGPHTARLVRATSSALSSVTGTVTLTWTNAGAAGTYYAGIRGYLAFTTGTYSFAVIPLSSGGSEVEDSDLDGIWDVWEFIQFGWLDSGPEDDDDGDGFNNLSEFYAKTSPTNSASALLLQPRKINPSMATVNWPAVPDSLYRLWRSTNLTVGGWIPLESIYHPAQGGTNLQWNEALNASRQFYKVELYFDP